MEFGVPDSSIHKPHQGFSFELSPSPSPIALVKKWADSDTGPSCDQLNVSNVSYNLKVHPSILLQTLLKKPS
jgi:hypothetical protein